MCNEEPLFTPIHAFVVRIWWEPGATSPDGGLAWRGTVQDAMDQHRQAFQSLDEMVRLIRRQIGDPEGERSDGSPPAPAGVPGPAAVPTGSGCGDK